MPTPKYNIYNKQKITLVNGEKKPVVKLEGNAAEIRTYKRFIYSAQALILCTYKRYKDELDEHDIQLLNEMECMMKENIEDLTLEESKVFIGKATKFNRKVGLLRGFVITTKKRIDKWHMCTL